MTESRRDLVIVNKLAELDTLTIALEEFCRENGVHEDHYYDIRLALDEAISNIIKYGYDDQNVHRIQISLWTEATGTFVEIADDAKAFDPLSIPAPDLTVALEDQPFGGRGVFLIRQVMDRVEYQREGARNILRLTKLESNNNNNNS